MHICTFEAQTRASRQALWQLWTNPKNWPTWDSELASAELSGTFRQGVTGTLSYKDGSLKTFTVIKCEMLESLVLAIPITKGIELIIKRDLRQQGEELVFQQDLNLTGTPFALMMQRSRRDPLTKGTLRQMELLVKLLEGGLSPVKEAASGTTTKPAH
ncbi:hypothetical protein [Deinococcus roseus]|uniref:Polyketide cyclase n=1 Tax=Deinococcus roseus TaxID=392414 RepID=A0ABQ2CTR3_9DEIO|nr:hypothetical protein [Deinococcus roseus]GGJ18552.1 hypothetical protein GCM10008938_00830 [Deinococcus roseus]